MNLSPDTQRICYTILVIVCAGALALWVWAARDPHKRTPDVVRTVRDRPRLVESERSTPPARPVLYETPDVRRHTVEPVDEPDGGDAPVDADPEPEPTPVVPDNDGRGATVDWSPAAELAAVGDGELLPPGVPSVSIDDLDDFALWDAELAEDLRQLDNRLEAARRACTEAMVGFGVPLSVMQAIDLRDAEAHEDAIAAAAVATTGEIRLSLPPVGETPAQRKRRVKHEHRQRGLVGAAA